MPASPTHGKQIYDFLTAAFSDQNIKYVEKNAFFLSHSNLQNSGAVPFFKQQTGSYFTSMWCEKRNDLAFGWFKSCLLARSLSDSFGFVFLGYSSNINWRVSCRENQTFYLWFISFQPDRLESRWCSHSVNGLMKKNVADLLDVC